MSTISMRLAHCPAPRCYRQLAEVSNLARAEKINASVRAKVEQPFRTIKRQFGYAKVRYRPWRRTPIGSNLLEAFSNMLIGERYLPA